MPNLASYYNLDLNYNELETSAISGLKKTDTAESTSSITNLTLKTILLGLNLALPIGTVSDVPPSHKITSSVYDKFKDQESEFSVPSYYGTWTEVGQMKSKDRSDHIDIYASSAIYKGSLPFAVDKYQEEHEVEHAIKLINLVKHGTAARVNFKGDISNKTRG